MSVFSTVMLWRIQIESRSRLNAGLLSVRTGQPVDLGHSSVVELLHSTAGPVLSALTSSVNTGSRAVLALCLVVDWGQGTWMMGWQSVCSLQVALRICGLPPEPWKVGAMLGV